LLFIPRFFNNFIRSIENYCNENKAYYFLFIFIITIAACKPANNGTSIGKHKNKTVYAENFVWTFNKELIPVRPYTKEEAANRKHLKIESISRSGRSEYYGQ
jgi:hypothetical protein